MTNWGQLRWINDWIIQWRRHRYYRWWQLIVLWATSLAFKAPVITRSRSFPTLVVPCSTFLAATNTHWTLHDKCNMSFEWCCVTVILFVDGQRKLRAKCLAQQLQSCLTFSTRNKIKDNFFCLNIILIRL